MLTFSLSFLPVPLALGACRARDACNKLLRDPATPMKKI